MTKILFIIKRGFDESSGFLHNLVALLRSRLQNIPLIWVIGDSHVSSFENDIRFSIHNIGPATAFNLKNEKNTTNSNKKLFEVIKNVNRKKDIVLLVFGEIDCRIHIYNEFKKNNEKITISKLIENTILNYGCVLEKLKQLGVNFCVYSIPPAGVQGNIYNYPYYASREIRGQIIKEFNEKLKNFCEENSIKLIDIYPKVSDGKGFVLEEFAADEIHLNDKIVKLTIEELNQKFEI
jgi:lysophospholipase L1-like esterase